MPILHWSSVSLEFCNGELILYFCRLKIMNFNYILIWSVNLYTRKKCFQQCKVLRKYACLKLILEDQCEQAVSDLQQNEEVTHEGERHRLLKEEEPEVWGDSEARRSPGKMMMGASRSTALQQVGSLARDLFRTPEPICQGCFQTH